MGKWKHKASKLAKKTKKAGRSIIQGASHGTQQIMNTTSHAANNAVHETKKAVENVRHETGKVAEKVGHEVAKGGKEIAHGMGNAVHETKKIKYKITSAFVKDKINAAFDKKMHEAIDNIQKELEVKKAQDKTLITKTIEIKIKEATDAYFNQTKNQTLDEAEAQYVESLRLATAATHDCRYGFKDSIEEVLECDLDDYALSQFMEKRPLILAMQDLEKHENTEALSVLLPYFDKYHEKLSQENKNDYLFLKRHIESTTNIKSEKEVADNYFISMIQIILKDTKNKAIKISEDKLQSKIEVKQIENKIETIEDLVGKGADIRVVTWYKWSDDILKNPNCKESNTGYNFSPLHAAVHHADPVWIKYLLDHGAILVRDKYKRLPQEFPLWHDLAQNTNCQRKYQECKQIIATHQLSNDSSKKAVRSISSTASSFAQLKITTLPNFSAVEDDAKESKKEVSTPSTTSIVNQTRSNVEDKTNVLSQMQTQDSSPRATI